MAYTENLRTLSFEANADLSSNQYHFVKLSTDGQLAVAGDGEDAVGVLLDVPDTAGHVGAVAIAGVSKVKAGAAVSIGDDVASDASGRGVTAVTSDVVLGTALQAASEAGEIISVLIQKKPNPLG